MPRDALVLVIECVIGLGLTSSALALGLRNGPSTRMRVLLWPGLALFLVCGVNAMEAGGLSSRGKGLWMSGVVTVAAAGVTVLAGSGSEARVDRLQGLRRTAAFTALVFLVLFLLVLIFDVNPLSGLFAR